METTINSIWQKSKLLIKGLIIGVLVLLLLIPAHFVQELIHEREERQREAVAEVSSKWADRQNITGPVLVVPYIERTTNAQGTPVLVRHHAYFLPDKLDITAEAVPEKRHRGIYDVMLYSSSMNLKGRFLPLPLEKLKLNATDLLLDQAYLAVKITDARGLRNEVSMRWNDSTLTMNPSSVSNEVLGESFTVPIDLAGENLNQQFNFSLDLNLNGSEQLLFTPVGKETNVNVKSSWKDPSFTGGQLPDSSTIDKAGFSAQWKSLGHTHGFPQQWTDNAYTLGNYAGNYYDEDGIVRDRANKVIATEAFGVNLFVPVSNYQQTMRSIKYAILCILLTFTAFFLIETSNRKSVHPVQYALIGFALILFYTLLLSFSEYTGFNTAYAIAALATTGLITWFVKGLLGSMRLTMLLSFVLVLLYSYVFTILQLQDYALLLGSIGLFLTLAVVMYFSKKIQW